jgi:hypothetical protein
MADGLLLEAKEANNRFFSRMLLGLCTKESTCDIFYVIQITCVGRKNRNNQINKG